MSKRCLGCMEAYGEEFSICPHCGYVEGTGAEEAVHIVPGVVLHDRYVIGRVVGYGGFGVTYLAWDNRLEQKVAIKEYLPGEFSTRMPGQTRVTVFNGEKREQFHDGLKKFTEEAKKLAKFQNESGIVKVFDSFEENMTAYIVMEFLEGETLTSFLNRVGRVDEEQAIKMLTPVMNSLNVVHQAGILHRDIAPDNIFLTSKGEVKLIDFGASRFATTSHSRSLTVIIKPGYSPEEQYRSNGDQGPHTDVYSIGATLYKMITGKTPAEAMERRANFEKNNKDILEPIHKIRSNVSINRENAILNAMNVRIEDRTADIPQLLAELNATGPLKRRGSTIRKIDVYSWPLWVKILIPSVLAVIAVVGVLIATGVIKVSLFSEDIKIPEGMVVVPDVEQMSSDEAIKLIEENKLTFSPVGSVKSEYVDVGKIVLQTPVGGSYLGIGGTVELTISDGVGVVKAENGISTVPNVKWHMKDVAVKELEEAGLKYELTYEPSSSYEKDQVISQSVAAGEKVSEGTVITLVVSTGSQKISIPNVLGRDVEDARRTLTGLGLKVNCEYVKDNGLTENTVKEQDMIGGEVEAGTVVTLTIVSGKEVREVPNVVGKDSATAERELNGANFSIMSYEECSSTVEAGKIIRQEPAGGSTQVFGSQVTIWVSTGPESVYIFFNPCGGSVNETERTLQDGGTYGNLPTPVRNGYVFDGWYLSMSYASSERVNSYDPVTRTDSHTLYAKWVGQGASVYLDANGGYCDETYLDLTYGNSYGYLPTPTRDGYNFLGWYDEYGNQVTSSTSCQHSGQKTLTAKWEGKQIVITFDPAGGTCNYVSAQRRVGDTYGSLPACSNGTKDFVRWYMVVDGQRVTVTEFTTITTGYNHTIYAEWSDGSNNETHPDDVYLENFGNGGYVNPGDEFVH